jgi:hypothetical protein
MVLSFLLKGYSNCQANLIVVPGHNRSSIKLASLPLYPPPRLCCPTCTGCGSAAAFLPAQIPPPCSMSRNDRSGCYNRCYNCFTPALSGLFPSIPDPAFRSIFRVFQGGAPRVVPVTPLSPWPKPAAVHPPASRPPLAGRWAIPGWHSRWAHLSPGGRHRSRAGS